MKKKIFTISLLILVVVVSSFYYLNKTETLDSTDTVLVTKHDVNETGIKLKDTRVAKTEEENTLSSTSQDDLPKNTVPESVVKEWLYSRGYVDMAMIDGRFQEIPSDYNSYSDEVLKSLADSGDSLAQMYYSDRLIDSTNYPQAEKYAYLAVLNGLSKPIKNLVSVSVSKSRLSLSQGESEQAKQEFLNALAWFEVARIRNDRWLLESKSLYDVYAKDFDLTEDNMKQVERLGEDIYRSLEDERLNRGLGEFDNSLPGDN